MQLKYVTFVCLAWISLAFVQVAFGQAFKNLNFEQATIVSAPAGYTPFDASPPISAASALPSWTVREDGIVCNAIWGEPKALDETAVALLTATNGFYPGHVPLQGSYSLQFSAYAGAPPPYFHTASISQTGLVPATARSIQFLIKSPPAANGVIQATPIVTINGTTLSIFPQSTSAGIITMAADVSAYAGSTVDLTFLCQGTLGSDFFHVENYFTLDDIRFSTQIVPEPSTFLLLGIGAISLLGYRKRAACH
jgi:hypothetical protein